ncbi:hypothetical protein OCH239_15265 [Roseivivax halodurans JCM 10272]|uniref:Uncharacterized protein n=1 Tax=Roseivivax halodurans JCM 10272 TaxID=1449350 RepID=X7EAJ5_9RHOB|nr:hypothetical protein OCH239_15265 [Roseivivax halodurans JCM 10272]
MISDVDAFSALGARVGLMIVASRFFDGAPDRPNERLLSLADLPGVHLASGPARADLAFLHHPLAFAAGLHDPHPVRAETAVLVAHHPPFRGDGSLEYNPVLAGRRVRADLGCAIRWAPVSGVIRTQLRSFSPMLCMTTEDWINSFDGDTWRASRPVFSGARATVGRHGRPDILKWPGRTEDAVDPLTPGQGWDTRVMGLPTEMVGMLGPRVAEWEIVPFNAEPIRDFLERLDAFVYFHHDRWVEAFGRTVAEAILMERPCILDPRLKPTFGPLATYCRPAEARDRLVRLRADATAARIAAADRRQRALALWSQSEIGARLSRLGSDPGTRSRRGVKSASVSMALRKAMGLSRRQLLAGGA